MIRDKPIAVISGGSSGIGLACARELLKRKYSVILVARSMPRLEQARARLLAASPEFDEHAVAIHPLDVGDPKVGARFIETVEREYGPVELLLTSAGMAEPGSFLEQPIETHAAHIAVNYLGTLGLVHAVAQPMARRRRGHIILISSGAAFVGIYGYAAYAPSKFAVRGLGETLRSELAEHGISVSLAYPPDTDTPQFHAEQGSKPEVTKVISAGGGLYSSDAVAENIIRQALKGRFVITHGGPLLLLRWVHSFYGPMFIRFQQTVARKLAGKGR